MPRHRYMLDLLRNGITMPGEYNQMLLKKELTKEDILKIMDNASRVERAAKTILLNEYDLNLD